MVVLLRDAVLQFLNYSFLRNNFSHAHWHLSCQWWSFTSLHLPDLEVKVWELLPLQSVVYLPELNKGYNICSFILLLLPHNTQGRLREKTFIFFFPPFVLFHRTTRRLRLAARGCNIWEQEIYWIWFSPQLGWKRNSGIQMEVIRYLWY